MGEVIKVEKNGKFLGWYVRYVDSDGKRKKRASKQPSKALAQVFLAEIEGRIRRGQVGLIEPSAAEQKKNSITVAELSERFLHEYSRPRLRNPKKYAIQAGAAFHQRLNGYPLAEMPAASVRRVDIERHRDALTRDGYKPATVNDTIARISLVYNWASDRDLIDSKNPCSSTERMPTVPSEECYTREQVHRLLATEDPMVAAALYTGMRRGELAGLRWDSVDLDRACLIVKFSFRGPPKNGKPRVVPIHRELVPILRSWQAVCPATPECLVFPASVRGEWKMHSWTTLSRVRKVLKAAACPHDLDRPWHAMRRTFATLFSESGGARDALEDILGHTTSGNKITARYVLISSVHLARELDKLTLQPLASAKILRFDAYRSQAS